MTRGSRSSIAGSPVLVGATTTLIVVVAVFLAYNANSGLPFVPTYDLEANLPSAANLVVGNEVRIGGERVGTIDRIVPVRRPDGTSYAHVRMKLQRTIEQLPVDSRLIVRSRSALGLKYVEVTPGRSREGLQTGATIPVASARPEPVEIDEVLNMFDASARAGARRSLEGFGDGLAGRGADLGLAVEELGPLFAALQPVATTLADPDTRLARFFAELGDAAREVAPVAEEQAQLFAGLDTTFAALARVSRPFLQQTISLSPPTIEAGIRDLPAQRPFLRNTAALARELAPGVARLPSAAPVLADAFESGVIALRSTVGLGRRLQPALRSIERFSEDPLVPRGIRRLSDTMVSLRPTVSFLAPVQVTCNYATLFLRNVSSLLSQGYANGTWQRFIIIAAQADQSVEANNEFGPSSQPAGGPSRANHLHSNPYPNTASPGQERECEAGNEPYFVGRTTIGNVPGNQGVKTSGQEVAGEGAGP